MKTVVIGFVSHQIKKAQETKDEPRLKREDKKRLRDKLYARDYRGKDLYWLAQREDGVEWLEVLRKENKVSERK